MKKIFTLGIMLLFLGMTITPTSGTNLDKKSTVATLNRDTLYVGGTGTGNYTSIQDAIDNASSGDTVFVYDDSSPYYENVFVDKSIDLIGENRNTTVIDGSIGGDTVYVSADWVNISGFKIRNSIIADAGIELHSNHSAITGNNISSNNWDGICLRYSNYNNISGNFFSQNKYSMSLYDSGNNTISGNYLTYNDYGIALVTNSHFNIISENNILGIFGRVNNDLIYIGSDSNNNTVTNNIGSDSFYGIRNYGSSSGNIISGNIITNCDCGISLPLTSSSIVCGNMITNCDSYGIHSWRSDFNMFSGNVISGNSGHGLFLEDSFINNAIFDNNIHSNEGNGIYLKDSSTKNNNIFNNNINSNNGQGILLGASSHDNAIFDNNITFNGGHGIYLKDSSHDNTIFDNNVNSNEGYGFYLKDFPYNNTISGNNVNSNIGHGFCLNDSSHDNIIIYNNVSLNNGYGILIENGTTACINNIVYRNNFVNNTFGGYDECNNTWDNGYPSGGNYWSEYNGSDDFRGQNQDMPGYDGIGDTPNIMHGGDNQDRYPLIYLWGEQLPVANYTYIILDDGGILFDGSSGGSCYPWL